MALHRRQLLAAVSAGAGTVVVPGCIDDLGGERQEPISTPTPNSAAAVGCPEYEREEVGRVACSTDPPEDTLVFDPDTESADLPRAELACRLENDREEQFESNFYNTTLHKYDGGEWWYLGPYVVPQPLHILSPGETHIRRFLVDNTDLKRVRFPEPEDRADEYEMGRHGLGPGTYALAIASSSEGVHTRYAAAFTLRGEPVPLTTPETVTDTERDGERRIVRVEPMLDGDADRYTLTVRRRPDTPREPRPYIDEQLYHPRHAGLRAAFEQFETDVTAVEVRGDDSQLTRNLTSGHGPNFIEYDDESFELRVDPYDE
ncbi:MAG: hypothetical protein ACI8UR_001710 [Natronomonas sp.]|jgi:hypothetical protein|uniref:hypothetical protein n=1 Tax=Natronomonas sp. TaxID=2184060 RepID=UPI003988C1F3